MKKLILLTTFALIGLSASAQQEENDYLPDGILTLEWRFNPFDYEGKPKRMAEFNARMFLDAKDVIRLGIGFGFDRDKDEKNSNKDTRAADAKNYDVDRTSTTTINKETTLKIALGYEYHFANTGRLDFYVGAEAGYLGRFYNATKETSINTTNVTTSGSTTSTATVNEWTNYDYKKSNADRTKFNENGITASIFTGIDFYVYKKLYIGAELGITFNTGKKANGTYTKEDGRIASSNGTQTDNWTEKFSSETGATLRIDNLTKTYRTTVNDYAVDNSGKFTKLYIEPAIRIGWMF